MQRFHIRVFKAVDELNSCERYYEGHFNVLKFYGVTKITSASPDWFFNPNVYCIVCESEDGEKVYGGARIHTYGETLLPIEEAVKEIDSNIHRVMQEYAVSGTGELCGLWNSKEVAGLGIGKTFLIRAGVVLTTQLNLGSLFALSAEHTVESTSQKGFVIEKTLGNNGTFYYPKLDLIATVLILKDPAVLSNANTEEKKWIFDLRNTPVQKRIEESPTQRLEISYNLKLENK